MLVLGLLASPFLSKEASMAKGVDQRVVRNPNSFKALAVGVHAADAFASLFLKTVLRLWLVKSGPSFLNSSSVQDAYRIF